MNSPLENHLPLESVTLTEGLKAYRCPETGGHWIPAENYWLWQRSLPSAADHGHSETHEVPISEFDNTAKFCPESGTIMTRYKVGHGLNFRIDRSITGGIWLDQGEWEALTTGNLHQELHLVFTSPRQKAIRNETSEKSYELMLKDKLGEELYQRLAALRADLSNHPSKAVAIAYLQG
jgi:Zn-finger nucleic acid-binding protein